MRWIKGAIYNFLVVYSGICFGQQTPEYQIYFTNEVINNQPSSVASTEFDCSDRIHVVVTATGLSNDSHQLKVRWLDPANEQKELTRFAFNGLPRTQIWAWLQLHGPTGAIIGQMFDPSFGMEEFIGEWYAEVYIDGKVVAKQPFKVLC